jgi:hypothetical protein
MDDRDSIRSMTITAKRTSPHIVQTAAAWVQRRGCLVIRGRARYEVANRILRRLRADTTSLAVWAEDRDGSLTLVAA